ncbi:hypothetical protein Nepgr_011948 [Nepenthes gracilis]|uniref:Uncharacterized protein n=1 Tax=Nepenthes gracilis TaxID=150966 RepID=A0AAD3XME9_NEPGR|nr:hypothetical protein Nepgr_011948 [Nepenthes gracilis]
MSLYAFCVLGRSDICIYDVPSLQEGWRNGFEHHARLNAYPSSRREVLNNLANPVFIKCYAISSFWLSSTQHEQDILDQQLLRIYCHLVTVFIKAYSSNADTIAHKQGVVLILSEELHSVASQFDHLRAIQFQDAIN